MAYVSKETLNEVVDFCLTETDTITLMDIPCTVVSEDADDAEAMKETMIRYTGGKINKTRVDDSTQTFNEAPMNKETQTAWIVHDKGTGVTSWDIDGSFCDQNEGLVSQEGDSSKTPENISEGQPETCEACSSTTADTGVPITSLIEMETPELQRIMMLESFQKNLTIMERIILLNNSKLPSSMIKPMTGDMSKKIEESSSSPILECLWTFSCSLTNKSIITSMALNKQNPWPMKVFHCRSSVTSLEFSSTDPDLLAVGMFDGPVAACNIRSEEEAFVPNNSVFVILQDSNMYLVGTWLGSIHQGSLVADTYSTYERQFSSVNHVEWSPFCSDAFLSCSDRTIELWKQDRLTPLMSFTSTQSVVLAARWSPKWPTIFAAINQQQLEIWDLRSSTRDPILVARPAPGVTMTSLLFAGGTDCVLVGDSDGIVTVYHFKNVDLGEGPQMETLEDIIA
ncbi:dynein axonemal intermediate chain 4-like [Antennarius striatus]|uniref:dynein axonemal intermediate chain 4-like n=1 Tax=Antennarius striatus TaxID=241820 RepID=UPI0035B0CAE8